MKQQKFIPVMTGPLSDFDSKRAAILKDVVNASSARFAASNAQSSLDLILGEALFLEKLRIRKQSRLTVSNLFTYPRTIRDRKIWGSVHGGLLKGAAEVDRQKLLKKVLEHYSEEIGGHFNPRVYDLAVRLVPWAFNWLLNAASLRHFMPWSMTESVQSRLHITGHVPELRELSKKGTILLVPTHQSNIDSVVIGYVIYLMSLPPFAYGAGLNLFSNPVLSFFMSGLGAYTVDRLKNSALYKETLKNYSIRILQEGVHSIFFPGGGRVRSGAIESHLKLGLLGTGIQAQIRNVNAGRPNPNVYIVPMVISYDFVLEASSLIEHYLTDVGKHRFLGVESEPSLPLAKAFKFFWNFFASQSGMTVRIGRPMDVFGNLVDEQGRSLGPNGTLIDTTRWLMTRGEVREDAQRDREYTSEMGHRLVDAYYRENTVVPTHLVAFTYFMALRRKYIDLDLFRFLRLSLPQRSLPYEVFLEEARHCQEMIREAARKGELCLNDELRDLDTEAWVKVGLKQLGVYHESAVVKVKDGVVFTEDMNLLYYYRNRLSGYGFTLLANVGRVRKPRGELDEKGFLA